MWCCFSSVSTQKKKHLPSRNLHSVYMDTLIKLWPKTESGD